MIHPARYGARALSAPLSSSWVQAAVPQAESSRHALVRALHQQRQLFTASSSGRSKGKGREPCSATRSLSAAAGKPEDDPGCQKTYNNAHPLQPGQLSARPLEPLHSATPTVPWPSDTLQIPMPNAETKKPTHILQRSPTSQLPIKARRNPLNTFSPNKPLDLRSRFNSMAHDDPLFAFLCVYSATEQALSAIEPKDFDRLYNSLGRLRNQGQHKLRPIARCDATVVLERLRRHLESKPAENRPENCTPEDASRFSKLRGPRLINFLLLSVWLECPTIARETFIAHTSIHSQRDLLNEGWLTLYATELHKQGQNDLIIDSFTSLLFPTDPPHIPIARWSPSLVGIISQAFLASQNALPVVRIINEYQDAGGKMTAALYRHLVQALVQIGHHDDASAVRTAAHEQGFNTERHKLGELFAVLRGQRALGFDPALEAKVLADIQTHPPEAAAKLLHQLIRLRLDNSDYEGAKRLFGMFQLGMWDEPRTKDLAIPPLNSTISLAFQFIARNPNEEQFQAWWTFITSKQIAITDTLVAALVRGLAELGKIEEAFETICNFVRGVGPEQSTWKLPNTARVSIETMNQLIKLMSREEGIPGLERATNLMRDADIPPNHNTYVIIINAIRQNMSAEPLELALLLKSSLERSKNVKAHIGHIDAVLAEAVKSANEQSAGANLSNRVTAHLRDPTAGLIPVGEFSNVISSILDNLRAREIQSRSTSMESRLRFEAMMGRMEGGLPTAQHVWNQLMDMGYRLNQRHLVALMKGYAECGNMLQAAQVPHVAREMGVAVNRAMYMVLLRGWAKTGHIRRAQDAYESIRGLGKSTPDQGLDLVAVTGMASALYKSRRYATSARLVREDLVCGDFKLDDTAIKVGMTALRWVGDEVGALRLLERRNTCALDFSLRNIVNKCAVHLKRKVEQGRANGEHVQALKKIQEILAADSMARPYLDDDSAFTPPIYDRVPRPKPVDGKRGSRPSVPSKPEFGVYGGARRLDRMLLDQLRPLSPESRQAADQHRMRLEAEIVARRPLVEKGHRASFTPDTSSAEASADPRPTPLETQLIEDEMIRFEQRLRYFGLPRQANRKAKPVVPERGGKKQPQYKGDPVGKVEIQIRTARAAHKRKKMVDKHLRAVGRETSAWSVSGGGNGPTGRSIGGSHHL